MKPSCVVHCDWSIADEKRWMTVARRKGNDWLISEPQKVGPTTTLFDRATAQNQENGCVFFGFDFPIGVPSTYGEKTGFSNFRDLLDVLGHDEWSDWFRPADKPLEISLRRPFYPARSGGTLQAHLFEGLGIGKENLLRLCERPAPGLSPPSMLFWTMGASQVGKAAIAGWRELIQPFRQRIGIWPFDGGLADLFRAQKIVVAESYPADAYAKIGIPRSPVWSKRRQEDRQRFAPTIQQWFAARPDLQPDDGLLEMIDDGFGSDASGEDRFDALMGLFPMIEIVEGRHTEGVPDLVGCRDWEGWILGRSLTARGDEAPMSSRFISTSLEDMTGGIDAAVRQHGGASPDGDMGMTSGRYYSNMGGLPGQTELLSSKATFKTAYAVIPKRVMSDIVTSVLPHWDATRAWIIARPMTGFSETFAQYIMEVAPGGGSERPEPNAAAQAAIFVVEGEMTIVLDGTTHHLREGSFAYLPAGAKWTLKNNSQSLAKFHWVRKKFQAVEGLELPPAIFSHEDDHQLSAMPDTDGKWATTRFIDPADVRYDMHLNIVTFQPGALIPFMETHVMEHGLYVLEGKAVYRLNDDWVEVEAGDFMWLRAFCPQACYAGGPGRFRYLLYKDVNRHVDLW